jgi:IS30 family transposase
MIRKNITEKQKNKIIRGVELGVTILTIAKKIGVNHSTLRRYIRRTPEILEAIKAYKIRVKEAFK